ncbi:MAG: anthranilate synthase component I [Methanomicrobium sp.]|nr:anthranilate synthase component I [Methanomicrobium sp.]
MYIYVQKPTSIVDYDRNNKRQDGDAGGMDTGMIQQKGKADFYPSPDALDELKQNLTNETLIPVYRIFNNPGISPASAYETLRQDYGFLLESMEGNEKNARYSVIGCGLLMHIVADPDIHITGEFNPAVELEGKEISAESLDGILKSIDYKCPDIPGYSGGLAGYFSYDLALKTLEITGKFSKKPEYPLAEFMMPDEYIIFDHAQGNITVLRFLFKTKADEIDSAQKNALSKINETEMKLFDSLIKKDADKKSLSKDKPAKISEYKSGVSQNEFEDVVRNAKEYIYNGDIFQVVISKRSECSYENDPFLIYRQMRRLNPSPYMYFLDFSDKQVIGASPEMLIKVDGKKVSSVPIAGTRKRGKDAKEDLRLEKELLADKKECAEHLMLVDLSRNDIGRVCRYGSVKVTDFMSVEKFSHVQHIVSTVGGELLDDKTSLDAFMSCFPAGTVSGAPKIRAMQIIDELEKTSRGLYAGAVGYIGFNKNIDLAITIRTVVVKDKTAYFQSGAGIVADSVPESEFTESENKAASMRCAIESAGDVL